MRNTSFKVLAVFAFLGCTLTVAARAQKSGATTKTSASDPGEEAFRHNCGRCHNAPESLSPREVKAVVRQMRVRAMLTQKDSELILKYLAP
jgi:mono/diheme cytochrome c family protein